IDHADVYADQLADTGGLGWLGSEAESGGRGVRRRPGSATRAAEQLVEVTADDQCAERQNADRLDHRVAVLQVSHLINVPCGLTTPICPRAMRDRWRCAAATNGATRLPGRQ